ncbi:hypothetical protein [Paenibacillus sp. NPDC057967]|uniref:hypothetical protein n=1 Tax=Paenibacillus sp. NPDC057967 TaxID=3346293 RepID=UPI0036DF0CD5
MQEVIEKRTATSKTYSLGSGKYQTEYFSYPVHYLAEDGKTWLEVDTNVVGISDWEFTEGVKANFFRTYFGDQSSDNSHLYSVEFKDGGGERWINFKLKNAKPSCSEISGNSYRFVDCFDGVDVSYDVLPDSVKETIWLDRMTTTREFLFTVKTGGTEVCKVDGELVIKDSEDGKLLWSIAQPYMEDAEGNVSYGVMYEIDHDGEFPTLRVAVTDEDFLRDAIYPVAIDPSVVIGDATGFKFYQSSERAGAGMMGASADGYSYTSSFYYTAFDQLKKDLARGVKLVNAYIDLYCTNTTPPNDVRFGNGGAVFYTISSHWNNGSAPSTANATWVAQVKTPGATGKWHRIDVKPFVTADFHGLRMVAGDGYTRALFASPTHDNTTLRPMLVIQYLLKPVIGFHDGTGVGTDYYSDGYDNIFKLLDFGTLVAGQTSAPVRVFVKNLAGFEVTNLQVFVPPSEFPERTGIELSQFNSPFIPEQALRFNGTYVDEAEAAFYVRIVTQEDTMVGGDFNIYAKADPL